MMTQILFSHMLFSSMVAVDMIILHVFILILSIPSAKSSQNTARRDLFGITWNRAEDACKPYGLENRADHLRSSGIRNENEFWIGKAIYSVPTRWFEIIGCFQIAENHIHSFPTVASIRYCKQKCDSENMGSYFGYRQKIRNTQTHNCTCLPNGIDQIQPRDMHYCLNSTDFFVYKDYNGTVSKSSDPGSCATICCGNCNRITANGHNLEGRRCSSVNNTIVGTSQNFRWASDYFASLEFCMKINLLLPSSNYCQKIERKDYFKGQISWTNVFREEIEMIKMKDFNKQPQRCFSGIFITIKGHTKLNETEQNCIENKTFFICKTKIKTQNTFYTINNGKEEHVNISPDPLFPHGTDKRSYQSTGLVIGGVLGAFSMITVLVVLIVCKVRSKGMFTVSNTRDYEDTHRENFQQTTYQDLDNTNQMSLTATSNQTSGIDESSVPVYEEINQSVR